MSNIIERHNELSASNISGCNFIGRNRYYLGEHKVTQAEKGFQFCKGVKANA